MNLTGQLLVSMPSLEDERFFKTVIYMCAHSKEGAMGIIINKKIDYDLYPDLLEQLGIDKPLESKKLFIRYGGPVESGRGRIRANLFVLRMSYGTSRKCQIPFRKVNLHLCRLIA